MSGEESVTSPDVLRGSSSGTVIAAPSAGGGDTRQLGLRELFSVSLLFSLGRQPLHGFRLSVPGSRWAPWAPEPTGVAGPSLTAAVSLRSPTGALLAPDCSATAAPAWPAHPGPSAPGGLSF